MTITYGSVCSGIEAATLAWEPLGWQAAWFAEIEKFPSQVLARRWPGVTNFGDMTQLPMYLRNGWITVRRLMPVECELLQGMPRDHTAIPGAADGPRYKAIGNSKAVPVVRWIGRRMQRELRK